MRLLRRLGYLLHRRRREQDLADEIAFHRELAAREHRASGLPPEDAWRAANRQMGNTTLAREAAHHVWVPAALQGVVQDLHYAWRGLGRSKALLAVACLSLGLSTGFGTALFSVVNAVVLQPVSAQSPDALVRFWVGNGNRISWLNLSDLCEDTPGVSCAGYRVDELRGKTGTNRSGSSARSSARSTASRCSASRRCRGGCSRPTACGRRATPSWSRTRSGNGSWAGTRTRSAARSCSPDIRAVIGVLPRGFRSIWGLGISPSLYCPPAPRRARHDAAR